MVVARPNRCVALSISRTTAPDSADTLLQNYQATLLHFQAVSDRLEPGEVKKRLDRAIGLAARAITEGRDAIQELRSSPTHGDELAAALKLLGE